jgi:hypothetical protein
MHAVSHQRNQPSIGSASVTDGHFIVLFAVFDTCDDWLDFPNQLRLNGLSNVER